MTSPSRRRYLHNTQQTLETNIDVLSGIRTRDPSNQAVSDLRFRLHGHRDRQLMIILKRMLDWTVWLAKAPGCVQVQMGRCFERGKRENPWAAEELAVLQ